MEAARGGPDIQSAQSKGDKDYMEGHRTEASSGCDREPLCDQVTDRPQGELGVETESTCLLAILLTCFNRRETTLRTLAALKDAVAGSCQYRIFLVDDCSTDGTAEAVSRLYPDAVVVCGTGNLFWNGGMRLAWLTSLQLRPDFFLWLNDDTELRPGAIRDLLRQYWHAGSSRTIVVGCTISASTAQITYGGYRRVEGSLSRLKFRRLRSGETQCDNMNGNCVLIPAGAAYDVGINSEHYQHGSGDNDYAFRARRSGYQILQLADPVGYQELNTGYQVAMGRLTIRNWRFIFTHPKGIPWREWLWFCRQHAGILWPINFALRYLKILRFK